MNKLKIIIIVSKKMPLTFMFTAVCVAGHLSIYFHDAGNFQKKINRPKIESLNRSVEQSVE
jgi:hypothetical protein